MRVFKFTLAFLLIAADPFLASAAVSELDEERFYTRQTEKAAPPTVIVRENKDDGTRSVAIDRDGACANNQCDVEKLAKLNFTEVDTDATYALDGKTLALAKNELNRDAGADHESWFFGFFLAAIAVGAWAYHRNRDSRVYVYNPTPYWAGYYGSYNYRACGYKPEPAACNSCSNNYYNNGDDADDAADDSGDDGYGK